MEFAGTIGTNMTETPRQAVTEYNQLKRKP